MVFLKLRRREALLPAPRTGSVRPSSEASIFRGTVSRKETRVPPQLHSPKQATSEMGSRRFVGASPTFRQKARCMHKRWIQAIFLCHQLRQVFLFFHSADFGQSSGEAQRSARSDTGSRGSALRLRRSEGISARPHWPMHRAPATPAVGLRGPAPTPARPFRPPLLAPSPGSHKRP